MKTERGFTLIELLVAISLMGILLSTIIVVLDPLGQIQGARDTQRKNDLALIQRYLEEYHNDNGRYPGYNTTTYQILNISGSSIVWGSNWQNYGNLPRDPTANLRRYAYYSNTTGQSYWLYSSLEITTDPQACNSGDGTACDSLPDDNICDSNASDGTDVICNYAVTSSDVLP